MSLNFVRRLMPLFQIKSLKLITNMVRLLSGLRTDRDMPCSYGWLKLACKTLGFNANYFLENLLKKKNSNSTQMSRDIRSESHTGSKPV